VQVSDEAGGHAVGAAAWRTSTMCCTAGCCRWGRGIAACGLKEHCQGAAACMRHYKTPMAAGWHGGPLPVTAIRSPLQPSSAPMQGRSPHAGWCGVHAAMQNAVHGGPLREQAPSPGAAPMQPPCSPSLWQPTCRLAPARIAVWELGLKLLALLLRALGLQRLRGKDFRI
jgi:hypothetical protein